MSLKYEDLKVGMHVEINCGCTGYIEFITEHGIDLIATKPSHNTNPLFVMQERAKMRQWDRFKISKGRISCGNRIVELAPEPEDPDFRAARPVPPEPIQQELFP